LQSVYTDIFRHTKMTASETTDRIVFATTSLYLKGPENLRPVIGCSNLQP